MHLKGMYKIAGMHSTNELRTNATRTYETYDDALHAATVQAQNCTNVQSGNAFVIFKAIEVVSLRQAPVVVEAIEE